MRKFNLFSLILLCCLSFGLTGCDSWFDDSTCTKVVDAKPGEQEITIRVQVERIDPQPTPAVATIKVENNSGPGTKVTATAEPTK